MEQTHPTLDVELSARWQERFDFFAKYGILVKQYAQNHGDQTSTRTGFVLDPGASWTFQLPKPSGRLDVPAEKLTRNPPKR
jgi:hypothetical protein